MALLNVLLLVPVVVAFAAKPKGKDGPTPVDTVITLLEDLKTQVEGDGKSEAGTYDKFACFCKTTTKTKSKSITEGQDKIDQLTADIEADTADKVEKSDELSEREKKHEELTKELEEVTARCDKEMAEFDVKMADLDEALGQLGKAIKALKASKSLLQVDAKKALLSVQQQVASSLALADALGLVEEPKAKALQAFIQQSVDPDDPAYKFQSGDIITLLEKLETEFDKKKTDTQKEWDAAKKVCTDLKKGINDEMKTNSDAMQQLKTDIDKLKIKIAKDKASLVLAEDALKDDSQYLRDLQLSCEDRAKEWDQRTVGRNDEIKAIAEALDILKNGKNGKYRSVKELDQAANERALLIQAKNKTKNHFAAKPKAAVTLLQIDAANSNRHGRMIALHKASGSTDRAVEMLQGEGARLESAMLSALAKRIKGDPFAKVKVLIQELIQRLLNEATQEATKKGFCDEELGKAEHTRDGRFADIKTYAAEHEALKSEKIRLDDEIVELTDSLTDLRGTLKNATDDRATEKAANLLQIKDAKEGLLAIGDAIKILTEYYGTKGKIMLQASPVDEDTGGPGFKGDYRGNQDGGQGIIAVLEVIESDFDRTVRHTTAAEKESLAAFVKLDRSMKVDIETKQTHLDQDKQDLKNTEDAMAQQITDITDAQALLDDAIKTIEGLKPMCIDTNMSYEARMKKREDEITALKKAMCLLDPDKVDASTHGNAC